MNSLPRLYAIADASFDDPVRLARDLFVGGATLVQVRNKTAPARVLLDQVDRILATAPDGTFVIVNDRADVAWISGAAGVHLGQADLPAPETRKILGVGSLIGVSTHNLDQALQADQLPVDYLALGPVYPTTSKVNPDPVIGVAGLAEICRSVRKPVVAIGGITLENAAEVFHAGVHSVAVIRDLLAAPNISARMRRWIDFIVGLNLG